MYLAKFLLLATHKNNFHGFLQLALEAWYLLTLWSCQAACRACERNWGGTMAFVGMEFVLLKTQSWIRICSRTSIMTCILLAGHRGPAMRLLVLFNFHAPFLFVSRDQIFASSEARRKQWSCVYPSWDAFRSLQLSVFSCFGWLYLLTLLVFFFVGNEDPKFTSALFLRMNEFYEWYKKHISNLFYLFDQPLYPVCQWCRMLVCLRFWLSRCCSLCLSLGVSLSVDMSQSASVFLHGSLSACLRAYLWVGLRASF